MIPVSAVIDSINPAPLQRNNQKLRGWLNGWNWPQYDLILPPTQSNLTTYMLLGYYNVKPALALCWFTTLISCFGSINRDVDEGAGCFDCAGGYMTHVRLSLSYTSFSLPLLMTEMPVLYFIHSNIRWFHSRPWARYCQRLRVIMICFQACCVLLHE